MLDAFKLGGVCPISKDIMENIPLQMIVIVGSFLLHYYLRLSERNIPHNNQAGFVKGTLAQMPS